MTDTRAIDLDDPAVVVATWGRTAVAWVGGVVDPATAHHLRQVLDGAVRAGADHVIVDLAAVTYLGSAGIEVLLGLPDLLTP